MESKIRNEITKLIKLLSKISGYHQKYTVREGREKIYMNDCYDKNFNDTIEKNIERV